MAAVEAWNLVYSDLKINSFDSSELLQLLIHIRETLISAFAVPHRVVSSRTEGVYAKRNHSVSCVTASYHASILNQPTNQPTKRPTNQQTGQPTDRIQSLFNASSAQGSHNLETTPAAFSMPAPMSINHNADSFQRIRQMALAVGTTQAGFGTT